MTRLLAFCQDTLVDNASPFRMNRATHRVAFQSCLVLLVRYDSVEPCFLILKLLLPSSTLFVVPNNPWTMPLA